MNEEDSIRGDKRSLALAGLILAITGLLCSFLSNWRMLALVISLIGLAVSIYAINHFRKKGTSNKMSVPAIICGTLGIIISGYFLFVEPHVPETPAPATVPEELRDSASIQDQDQSKDLLKNIIDTSQSQTN